MLLWLGLSQPGTRPVSCLARMSLPFGTDEGAARMDGLA